MLSLLVRISFWILESHLVPSQPGFLTRKTLFHNFSEAREPTQAAWYSLENVTEKTWYKFSPSQRGGTGIQWWSIHVPQAAKQESHRQHKQTQHSLKSTDERVSDLVTFHLEARTFSSLTWKEHCEGLPNESPLGITHLKKAELWVKGKDQRERGTCWIISWMWLLLLRQRKIQDLPHQNIDLVLSATSLVQEEKGWEDNFKVQFN